MHDWIERAAAARGWQPADGAAGWTPGGAARARCSEPWSRAAAAAGWPSAPGWPAPAPRTRTGAGFACLAAPAREPALGAW